jgi:hypothetical protein
MNRKGQIGNFVEPEGSKWNISRQTDPKWNTGIRSRGQIGIREDKMEYLTVEGTKWNIITLIFLLAKLETLIRFLLGKHLHDIDIDGWLAWLN